LTVCLRIEEYRVPGDYFDSECFDHAAACYLLYTIQPTHIDLI